MKKAKSDVEESLVFRPGGTERAVRELAEATHRLSMRRIRDSLPGKIATRQLVLRAPIRGDVPDLVQLADNKAIADRLVRLPHPYTGTDAVSFIETFAQRPDERPYAITLNERLIGVAGFTFVEGQPPELGYWLGEPYWGKGLMTEAMKGLIEAAHRTRHFETIAARVLADNEASLRVLEKLGFHRVGKPAKESFGGTARLVVRLEIERPRWM